MGWFGESSIEKAVKVVGSVADKGMSIWDKADFKDQEKSDMLLKLIEATKSQATSLSRRQLLHFIMGMSGSTLLLACVYSFFGLDKQYKDLLEIIEAWKVGYAFVATISFYYFTQFQPGGKK